jgi:hypothetical protein
MLYKKDLKLISNIKYNWLIILFIIICKIATSGKNDLINFECSHFLCGNNLKLFKILIFNHINIYMFTQIKIYII